MHDDTKPSWPQVINTDPNPVNSDNALQRGHTLPPGASLTDPPAWRWVFMITHHGFAEGWAPACKLLLIIGVPLALLIMLSLITDPGWALGTGAIVGGVTWLRRWRGRSPKDDR